MSQKNKTLTFIWRDGKGKKPVVFIGQPSILEVALANNVPLNHSCGGMGSCTTCRVKIKKGLESLAPRNELEQEMADLREFAIDERLGCQTTAVDGVIADIPDADSF